jgi:hypothetical protein
MKILFSEEKGHRRNGGGPYFFGSPAVLQRFRICGFVPPGCPEFTFIGNRSCLKIILNTPGLQ